MNNKRLYSPKYIREILNQYGFKFSKSLGQNFLIDGNIVRNTVRASGISKDDFVLEIGPGIGTLTEELALNAKKVIAVELDRKLIPILSHSLANYKNVEIIHGDILKIDIQDLIKSKMGGGPIKLVANLPYYITTPIIARLIEEDLGITSMVIMVQKEVAHRMVAGPGSKDYGSLSVYVNFYTEANILFSVPRTVFMPPPRVDSALVILRLKKELPFENRNIFFQVVRLAFGQRRKTLLNSMSSNSWGLDKAKIRKVLEAAKIPPGERAENLNIDDFINISKALPPLDI